MPKKQTQSQAVSSVLNQLVARPIIFPGEDSEMYHVLRTLLIQELAPRSPYEQTLAENLVNLEWESQRHRRMRDDLIRAKARDLAIGLFETGKIQAYRLPTDHHLALGYDLMGSDPERSEAAQTALMEYGIPVGEVFAEAYSQMASQVSLHERKLAEIESRRRRLREDYDRLRLTRSKHIDDAEIIE